MYVSHRVELWNLDVSKVTLMSVGVCGGIHCWHKSSWVASLEASPYHLHAHVFLMCLRRV